MIFFFQFKFSAFFLLSELLNKTVKGKCLHLRVGFCFVFCLGFFFGGELFNFVFVFFILVKKRKEMTILINGG